MPTLCVHKLETHRYPYSEMCALCHELCGIRPYRPCFFFSGCEAIYWAMGLSNESNTWQCKTMNTSAQESWFNYWGTFGKNPWGFSTCKNCMLSMAISDMFLHCDIQIPKIISILIWAFGTNKTRLAGGFNFFYSSPLLGEDKPILTDTRIHTQLM